MTTLGIIGGFGPESTARFYLTLQKLHQQSSQPHRMKTLIHSVPVPYEWEETALIQKHDLGRFLPLLEQAAKELERAGANLIVLPCNTLHTFIDAIQRAVSVQVLDLSALVLNDIQSHHFKSVGLLATSQTVAAGVYHRKFSQYNIHLIEPDTEIQCQLDEYIYDRVAHFMDEQKSNDSIAFYDKALSNILSKHVDVVLLGCTDLSDIWQNLRIPVIDTTSLLAKAVLDIATADHEPA
ncbi:aspartate/glutamate racemase family protein [Algicola sagamiensis]|uniref:aspartate/glutamate racemase family protein n=1 Tax=Algicola sagamiensis TaxID=163869 RepID=UPI00037CEF07|nr:amino acid racemase [Algicola sagamiensis]